MKVAFRNRQLERAFSDEKQVRRWGPQVGPRCIDRVRRILDAGGVDDLYELPALRFHPLHQDREGEYAIVLTGRWRLIVTLYEVEDGEPGMMVEEVSDRYGD